jgi:hypothetical protein
MAKIKIAAINTNDGQLYDTEMENSDVKEIVYKRAGNLYNSGFQTGVPGYVIKLIGDDDRIILVPEHAVTRICIIRQKDDNVIPDLPDAETAD